MHRLLHVHHIEILYLCFRGYHYLIIIIAKGFPLVHEYTQSLVHA